LTRAVVAYACAAVIPLAWDTKSSVLADVRLRVTAATRTAADTLVVAADVRLVVPAAETATKSKQLTNTATRALRCTHRSPSPNGYRE